MAEAEIGVIGGSGLYQMDGLTDTAEVRISTPFGQPSDAITLGTLGGRRVAFLPRHGRGHRISPSELNSKANVYALKLLGVSQIIAVSACGSMREDIAPLDIVIPDQLLDRTKARPNSFFGDGIVVHVGFADPFCTTLSSELSKVARQSDVKIHLGGTYVCIDGPQFSTKAESRIYRQWGVDVIGMTAIPEAKLAREAEICYAMLALVTDYDVWREGEAPVTAEMIVGNLLRNTETAKSIIRAVLPVLSTRDCACRSALKDAIITQADLIPERAKADLGLLVSRYLQPHA